jgi:hypothetical protein
VDSLHRKRIDSADFIYIVIVDLHIVTLYRSHVYLSYAITAYPKQKKPFFSITHSSETVTFSCLPSHDMNVLQADRLGVDSSVLPNTSLVDVLARSCELTSVRGRSWFFRT